MLRPNAANESPSNAEHLQCYALHQTAQNLQTNRLPRRREMKMLQNSRSNASVPLETPVNIMLSLAGKCCWKCWWKNPKRTSKWKCWKCCKPRGLATYMRLWCRCDAMKNSQKWNRRPPPHYLESTWFVPLKIPNCFTFRSDNRLWSRYPKMRKVDLGADLVVSSASVLLVIVISSTVVATSAEVHGWVDDRWARIIVVVVRPVVSTAAEESWLLRRSSHCEWRHCDLLGCGWLMWWDNCGR